MREIENFLKAKLYQKTFGHLDLPYLMPADLFLWGLLKGKMYKNTPRAIEQLKDALHQEIKLSTSTLWEKYSRIWRNTFKCAWM